MVKNHFNEPRYYEIRIEGHLNKTHARDLGDMSLQLLPNGQTLISGLPYENADGTSVRIDADFFRANRLASAPTAGPFEGLGPGELKIRVW